MAGMGPGEVMEMWPKYGGKLVWWHPVLTSMEITREMKSISMEVFYLLVKFWESGN